MEIPNPWWGPDARGEMVGGFDHEGGDPRVGPFLALLPRMPGAPPRLPPGPPRQLPQPPADLLRPVSLEDNSSGAISAINKILSRRAKRLHIYDPASKLKHNDTYDIGGTYAEVPQNVEGEEQVDVLEPELWFFFTITVCPGHNHLFNLFVCHRRVGSFSIGISDSNELNQRKRPNDKSGLTFLPESLQWQTFRSTQHDENFHIKTFCFSDLDVKHMENIILAIPIRILVNSVHTLSSDIVKKIKLNHDFGDVLAKQEKTDFVLISDSQKQYPVHKIFLAAHCPVFRNLIKNRAADDNKATIDISDKDMELLLQFIYTGTIKDILQEDCLKLLEIADRFHLRNLFSLTQVALGSQINIENAVEIAALSEKYKLEKLQLLVFNFIKNNPKVLETEGWKILDDVVLAKKLFQHIQTKKD